MVKYRLVLLDLDGTLLNSCKEISRRNREILEAVLNKGMNVTIITGRSYVAACDYVHQLGIKTLVVFQNGALIYDFGRKQAVHISLLEGRKALQIIRIGKSRGMYPVLYENFFEVPDMVVDKFYSGPYARYFEMNRWRVKMVESLEDYTAGLEHVAEVALVGEEKGFDSLEGLNDGISVVKNSVLGGHAFVEFFGPNSSKAHALQVLLKYFGVGEDETVFIGDNLNDISLMKRVGLPVAMGNAVEDVKKMARYVTTTNDEDGVAYALERVLRGEWI